MPYATESYNPPPIPPDLLRPIKTFDDVRSAVGKMVAYLQQVNSSDITYFQRLQNNVNQASTTQGPDIAAASTITVTKFMHVVTGSAQIANINVPANYAGQVMLIARDGFQLVAGGNISLIFSPNQLTAGSHVILTFIPSKGKWYTDSCRLTGTGGSFGAPSGGVFVTPSLAGTGININPSTFVISNTGVLSITGALNEITPSSSTGAVTLSLAGPHAYSAQTAHGVLVGEGTGPIVSTSTGTTGQALLSNGASADPTFQTLNTSFLSDITTGSYLPVLSGSSTAGSVTYSIQQGYYVRVGPAIAVTFNVQWSAFSGAVGTVQISLPVAVANLTNGNWFGVCGSSSGATYSGFTQLSLEAAPGASVVNIIGTASATSPTAMTVGGLGSSGSMQGTIVYRTA